MPAPKPTPPLHTRYRAALINRIMLGLGLPLVLATMVLILVANWPVSLMHGGALLATGGLLLMMAFILHVLVSTFKSAILLTNSYIIKKNTWPLTDKELLLNEIAGFRTTSNLIIIEPNRNDLPKLSLDNSIEFHDDFMLWLGSNYPDLDQIESEKLKTLLLSDEQLGSTPEERVTRLAQARRVGTVLNVLSGVVIAWLGFRLQPYPYAVGAGVALPLLAAGATLVFPGLMRVEANKNSPRVSVAIALLAPSIMLAGLGTTDSQPISYATAWPVMSEITMAFALLLVFSHRRSLLAHSTLQGSNASEWGLLLIGIAAYGFGATLTANAAFDQSKPILYQAHVMAQHKSTGKSTSYHLTISRWGPRATSDDIIVSQAYYEAHAPGDPVTVAAQPGRLGIPWFRVVEE